MQTLSSTAGDSPPAKKTKKVPWKGERQTVAALARKGLDLERTFKRCHSRRERDAIFPYLVAVYEFAQAFASTADCKKVGRAMLKAQGLIPRKDQRAFGRTLLATSDAAVGQRWKWARCLEHARRKKIPPYNLRDFIRKQGGINACAEGARKKAKARKPKAPFKLDLKRDLVVEMSPKPLSQILGMQEGKEVLISLKLIGITDDGWKRYKGKLKPVRRK